MQFKNTIETKQNNNNIAFPDTTSLPQPILDVLVLW